MAGAATTRIGYREPLSSSQFRALFFAQLVTIAGTSVAAVALTVVVYRRSDSPLLASLTFALGFLPYVLGGGLLAAIVDRVAPRRLVSGAALLSTPLAALMAWPAAPVPLLLALVFAVGTLASLAGGATASLVRGIVSDAAYVPARSLLRLAGQLAQIGGNAAGGVLLVALSPSGALLLDAASFAIAAAVVRLGVGDQLPPAESAPLRLVRDSLAGARALLGLPSLRRLLLLGWFVPMCSVAPEALAAPYVAAHHGSSSLVGWWLVALPVGVILGDIAGVRFVSPGRQRRLVAPAAAAGFLPYIAFVCDPAFGVGLGLLVVSGACSFYALGLDARLRDAAPPAMFARAMTLNNAGQMTLQGLGFMLAGALGQAIGPARAIAAAGCAGLGAVVLLLGGDLRPAARDASR
jgi:MFS family permease